jgi:membrane protein YdbS with pleckstrin-like domain
MSEFIQVGQMPAVVQHDFSPLDIRYKKVLMLLAAAYILVFLLVGITLLIGFVELISIWYIIMTSVAMGIVVLGLFYWVRLYFASAGYGIKNREVYYKSGVLFQSLIAIPFSRVQHCELGSGPLDRRFGLASLTIYTAGGDGSDLTIPGLAEHEALQIKQFITSRADLDEEE